MDGFTGLFIVARTQYEAMPFGSDRGSELPPVERERLELLRSAERIADLVELTDADSEHEAYFAAKREWAALRDRNLPPATASVADLPGDVVTIDGRRFVVNGITHADTDAEREFLRKHVSRYLEKGATVFCEQGIRPMYFQDVAGVFEMDDYRWAITECEMLDGETHLSDGTSEASIQFPADVADIASRFRSVTFSLIHSGGDIYGDSFRMALGDLASDFLMSDEDAATAADFESFAKSKRAAHNPVLLAELQRYYKRQFLPQPLEREWLRRHDRELEILSHARNERLADYARYHSRDADTVHLVVGAAHQPGVVYYLEQHRDGMRNLDDFHPV